MAKRNNRYRKFDSIMTKIVIGDAILFVLYLLGAAAGWGWLKVLMSVLAIGGSAMCLAYLYITKEWLKKRSRWMTLAFGAIILCIVVSLICGVPGPVVK